jgi:hypothetical protein
MIKSIKQSKTCTCYILIAHVDKSHTGNGAMLASLVREPLLPMMGIMCAGVSTFLLGHQCQELGVDRGSHMSLVGVDSFVGLGSCYTQSPRNTSVSYNNILQRHKDFIATKHTCGNNNILLHRFWYLIAINSYILQWSWEILQPTKNVAIATNYYIVLEI